jgi:ABC-type lipoprotein release transport system permease subunit
MKRARKVGSFIIVVLRKFGQLGTRMLMGCSAALLAAVLIFSAPEVGVAGAFGGVVLGGISAILLRPQLHITAPRVRLASRCDQ